MALALARTRIMGARYPYYLLADSRDGQSRKPRSPGTAPSSQPVRGSIRQGFVYERVPHITLKSDRQQRRDRRDLGQVAETLEPLREPLNAALSRTGRSGRSRARPRQSGRSEAKKLHAEWWEARIARQKEIDASIAAKAEFEYLYDKPYEDKKKVRVAGPFTVESLSPHRVLGVDENDELIDSASEKEGNDCGEKQTSPR